MKVENRWGIVNLTVGLIGITVGLIGIAVTIRETDDVSVRAASAGAHVEVPVRLFVPVVLGSRQATEGEIVSFLESALDHLRDVSEEGIGNDQLPRWEITVGGGRVFIYRTRNLQEFSNALNGVIQVLEAAIMKQDVEGVRIIIRGTERFYDIEGLTGVGNSAWVGFDKR